MQRIFWHKCGTSLLSQKLMPPKFFTVIFVLLALVISGCATSSYALQEDNIDQKISASPHIKRTSSLSYSPRKKDDEIEVFYKNWTFKPTVYLDWKTHFQIMEGTHPSKPYDSIAEIEHYQKTRYDHLAIAALRKVAANEGGDAIVEVWRSPVIDQLIPPAKILGYRYYATVVRYKETP